MQVLAQPRAMARGDEVATKEQAVVIHTPGSLPRRVKAVNSSTLSPPGSVSCACRHRPRSLMFPWST